MKTINKAFIIFWALSLSAAFVFAETKVGENRNPSCPAGNTTSRIKPTVSQAIESSDTKAGAKAQSAAGAPVGQHTPAVEHK